MNTAASSIGFSFVYQDPENGDTTFNGRFGQWRADIRFDPNDLAHSSAVVVIQIASAHDGVDIHDRGLPTAEWFDAAAHPTAEFRTTSIRRSGSGYEAAGQLTIKGHAQPVTLPFTLTIDGDHARMSGHLTISRRDFDIGVHSDANDMISQNVTISVRVDATPRAMSEIERAAEVLRAGGLVIFPTETVYGVGCDATNAAGGGAPLCGERAAAIQSADRACAGAGGGASVRRACTRRRGRWRSASGRGRSRLWRRGVRESSVAELACAGLTTIALRAPSHPTARALLAAFGKPIAAPSANRSGRVSATTAAHAAEDLGAAVGAVLDAGPSPIGLESTIVSVDDEGVATLLRVGAITREEIEEVTGPLAHRAVAPSRRPACLQSHYAPRARMRLDADAPRAGEAYLAFGAGAPADGLTLSASGDSWKRRRTSMRTCARSMRPARRSSPLRLFRPMVWAKPYATGSRAPPRRANFQS